MMMIRTHQNDSLNSDVWYTSRVTEAEGEVVYEPKTCKTEEHENVKRSVS